MQLSRYVPSEVVEWMTGNDHGSSALNIVKHFYQLSTATYDYPLDMSDFGRCYRMLKLFPNIDVKCMSGVNGVWTVLVERWISLVTTYDTYQAWKSSVDRRAFKEERIKHYLARVEISRRDVDKRAEKDLEAEDQRRYDIFQAHIDFARSTGGEKQLQTKHNFFVMGK